MNATVISVEGLSKRYYLGQHGPTLDSLRDALAHGMAAVRRSLRRPFQTPASPARRDEFWALRDVSFQVARGDRVGIVGRNGAGKSTLLKLLSRITEPTTGRIAITGRVASLLEIGTGFHPDLTGRENVYLNGAILGMSKAEIRRKFDEIVAFAEVESFLDTPVKRYSSGMTVRLAFAVAAHLDPEILIVDEVLAVGDAQFQKKCIGKMQDVSAGDGRTVFFVSHNMAAVDTLCTHGIFLTRGRVTHAGTAREVVDLYIRQGGSSTLTNAAVTGTHFDLCRIAAGAEDGAPLTTFKPAQIEIVSRSHQALLDAGVQFLIEDLSGAPVLGLDSRDLIRSKVAAKAGQALNFTFCIKEFPLNPGAYRLRVWLKSQAEFLHWEVPDVFDLSVENATVYGTRQIDRQTHGSTAVRVFADVRTEG